MGDADNSSLHEEIYVHISEVKTHSQILRRLTVQFNTLNWQSIITYPLNKHGFRLDIVTTFTILTYDNKLQEKDERPRAPLERVPAVRAAVRDAVRDTVHSYRFLPQASQSLMIRPPSHRRSLRSCRSDPPKDYCYSFQ